MNPSPFAISSPPTVQVTAALEPVRNILFSLWALTANDPLTGDNSLTGTVPPLAVDTWIPQAAAQLSPEQRQFNRLLFAVFGAALLPDDPELEFPAYLAALTDDADGAFAHRLALATQTVTDTELSAQAEKVTGAQIVEHLRTLWDGLLAAEWKRHTTMLSGMTRTINETLFSQPHWQQTLFSQPSWQQMTAPTALRCLLQCEPTDAQLELLAGVRRIVLVWSPHLLAHGVRDPSQPDTLWLLRKFDPQLMRREPRNRAEVLMPLTALADDSRLRILESLTEVGEQRAQELIAQLESSQGNVSRHLKQLVNAGFARERRAGDANKVYEFDPAGLRRLIFQLRQLLSSDNAQSVGAQRAVAARLQQVRSTAHPLLHGFLDAQGRVTRWSSKLKDQQAMMEYLAEKFEVEHGYSEKQVNDLLQQWYLDADFVLIRRSMVDAKLLNRTKDGARYWREK